MMFAYILLLTMVITNYCYSMVQKEAIIIKQITKAEELKQGLQFTLATIAKTYKNVDFSPEQKKYIDLEHRFSQLQTRVNPHDILMYDEKKNIIGFLASHLANDDYKRIILDNFYAYSEDVPNIYKEALVYIQKIYPQATKVWLALLKDDASSRWIEKLNLKESNYMDTFHNNAIFQGWEQALVPK